MNESKRNTCKIFVGESTDKIPMTAQVNVIKKVSLEEVRAVGEEKVIGMFESGTSYKIKLKILGTNSEFEGVSNFDLTIDYGSKTEKYTSCFVEENEVIADDGNFFWQQNVLVVACGKE